MYDFISLVNKQQRTTVQAWFFPKLGLYRVSVIRCIASMPFSSICFVNLFARHLGALSITDVFYEQKWILLYLMQLYMNVLEHLICLKKLKIPRVQIFKFHAFKEALWNFTKCIFTHNPANFKYFENKILNSFHLTISFSMT